MSEFTKDEWQLVRIEEPGGQVLGFICADGMIADLADCVNAEANARLIAQSRAMFAFVCESLSFVQLLANGGADDEILDAIRTLTEKRNSIIASVEGEL